MKPIYLFGTVGEDFTAKSVAAELAGADEVEVHVNSGGGDVFDGLAIYNVLKNHSDEVTIYVDGIAASAASLIICAGDNVYMAANGLIMVHQAAAGLAGYYGADELDKVGEMLATLKESIVTTYEARTGKPREELEKLVEAETWLDATAAKALGFVDDITGAVEAEYDAAARVVYVNKIKLDCKQLDFERMKAAVGAVAVEVKTMEEKQAELEKMLTESALKERGRIRSLLALKCDNSAVNSVLDLAIEDGKTVEEVQRYVDAIKSVPVAKPVEAPKPTAENLAVEKICAMIRDNMTSGAQEVEGTTPEKAAAEAKESQSKMLAEFINARLKGGVVK